MKKENTIITDKFGRVHDYLRISLTERCNLRCFYCMPLDGIELRDKAEFMTSEEVLHLAKTFVGMGVKKIRLTGGEPLIKKNAEALLRGLGKLPVELAITTNAVLVDKFIDVFKEAGIKNINVSLDSLHVEKANKITRRNYGERIMNNIQLLLDNDFNVKINTVLIKGVNDNEINDFIAWTKDVKVNLHFIEFMPFSGNDWDLSKTITSKEIIEIAESKFGSENVIRINDKPNDTARNYRIKGHKGSFGIISTITNPFCDSCNRIRLTADGKIKNCLFSTGETDLLSALRNGDDVKDLILESIHHKMKKRSGIQTFKTKEDVELFSKNRTMTSIGG